MLSLHPKQEASCPRSVLRGKDVSLTREGCNIPLWFGSYGWQHTPPEVFQKEVQAMVDLQECVTIISYLRAIQRPPMIVMKLYFGDFHTYFDDIHEGWGICPAFGGIDQSLMVDIGSALCYMGQKGYVHRDLKLKNIFIDKEADGEGGAHYRAIVGDLAQSLRIADLEGAGAAGTPLYRAPETLCDPAVFSNQSDIYSFGMVLYGVIQRRDVAATDFPGGWADCKKIEEQV